MSSTTLSQPITQYFKSRAGVDVSRAEAAEARADLRREQNDVAFRVKEAYYGILATERRRDAVEARIRAAELRITETRNAVDTGVALEVKAADVRAQIAEAKYVHGQLRDAVVDMKMELADLCGLPVDADLELAQLDGSGLVVVAGYRSRSERCLRPESRDRGGEQSTGQGARRVAGGPRRIHSRHWRVCRAYLSERRAFSLAQ